MNFFLYFDRRPPPPPPNNFSNGPFQIYKLYEEGKIVSTDDPLSKYAPDFAIKNRCTNENITLREIVSQMSGLPREAPCMYHCSKTNSKEQLALLTNRTSVASVENPFIQQPWICAVGWAINRKRTAE